MSGNRAGRTSDRTEVSRDETLVGPHERPAPDFAAYFANTLAFSRIHG
jgi:hypothetical protein